MDGIWSPEPPDLNLFHGMDLKRCPPGGKIGGLIVNLEPAGTYTHYWLGRTRQHTTGECPACDAGRRKEWHIYVPLYNSDQKQTFILELTAFAAQPLTAFWKRAPIIRGAYLLAERRTTKQNAKVHVTINEATIGKYALPRPVDVMATMARIWRTADPNSLTTENVQFDAERFDNLTGRANGTEYRTVD